MPTPGKMLMRDGKAFLVEKLYSGKNYHYVYLPSHEQDYLMMLAGGPIIAVGLHREADGVKIVGLTITDIAGVTIEEEEEDE